MSILNRASDGLAGVLVVLVKNSVLLGPMSKDKLLGHCCPKSLGDGTQEFAIKTLNRWSELGLFAPSEKGEIKVSDKFRNKLKRANAPCGSIADAVREVVLDPLNNENFWNNEENKASDFSRAVSWMLAQDVHQFVPASYSLVESRALEQADSADVVFFQNDTRWAGYVSWATFLGFGRSDSGKASGGFVTDPTPAIADHVAQLVPKKGDIAINDFIDSLAQAVPVIDGGKYRREVESRLRPEKWKSPDATQISTSLSRALLRLRASGHIRLERRSDSDARMDLIGRDRSTVESVTHVLKGDVR